LVECPERDPLSLPLNELRISPVRVMLELPMLM
jgi:hypothetical protein